MQHVPLLGVILSCLEIHGEISARRLRYGKEENDLNKKHEVWKSAKLSQTSSIKQTYLDVYFKETIFITSLSLFTRHFLYSTLRASYSKHSLPLINPPPAGLKSQPGLKFPHVFRPLEYCE